MSARLTRAKTLRVFALHRNLAAFAIAISAHRYQKADEKSAYVNRSQKVLDYASAFSDATPG